MSLHTPVRKALIVLEQSQHHERWVDPALAAFVLFSADALAHLRLTPFGFFLGWSGWILSVLATEWLNARHVIPVRLIQLAKFLLPVLWLAAITPALRYELTLAQILYLGAAAFVLTSFFRRWLRVAVLERGSRAAEALRILGIGGAAIWVTLPVFTDRHIGGVDAAWYANVLADFIQQWRQGVFPIFVGQGELAFNGGVHPYRSGPYYQYLAGLWDVLTFRALSVSALQHLTVLTSALSAGLGMYLAFTRLVPTRRGIAAAVAVIFVCSPAVLAPLYLSDQYMTYLAMGVVPVALYGNFALIRDGSLRAAAWLAVGLSLIWLAHPPQAILCCLATAVLQAGRLLFFGETWRDWRIVGVAAAIFAVLSLYYFVSMAEVPSPMEPSQAIAAVQISGAFIALLGLVRGPIWGQSWAFVVLLVGLAVLRVCESTWMWVFVAASAVAGVLSWQLKSKEHFNRTEDSWWIALTALIVAGFCVPLIGGMPTTTRNEDALSILNQSTPGFPGFFGMLGSTPFSGFSYQPGWGTWFLAFGVVMAALWQRHRASRLLMPVLILFAVSCIRIPILSSYWVLSQPRALVETLSFPLPHRLFPSFVAFACMGGFLWLVELPLRSRRAINALAAVLGLLMVWSVAQSRFLTHVGVSRTASRAETARLLRPDNVNLGAYGYDLMRVPHYVSHGKMDPRLESRLHGREQSFEVGPDEIAWRMEKAEQITHVLTSQVDPTAPTWLNLQPMISLVPGEHVLLRFEFLPKNYDGFLILKGAHLYHEYRLPDSGWPKAFGVGGSQSKVISLWNGGDSTEDVRLYFSRSGLQTADFGDFGRVVVSHYKPELSPIRTLSLIPYRVEVEVTDAAWLETPRAFLPGYRARVDGKTVPVTESRDLLARLPVEAGVHRIEMEFVGTPLLRTAWWISATAWALLIVLGWRKGRRPTPWVVKSRGRVVKPDSRKRVGAAVTMNRR